MMMLVEATRDFSHSKEIASLDSLAIVCMVIFQKNKNNFLKSQCDRYYCYCISLRKIFDYYNLDDCLF